MCRVYAALWSRKATDVFASIIVPTCDRPEYLTLTLAGLARQTVAPGTFEVVVVNDGTLSVAPAVAQFRDLNPRVGIRIAQGQPTRNRAAARNRGASAAEGDLFIFLDQDMIASAGFVESHLAAFGESYTVIVGSKLARAYTVTHDLDPVDRGAILRSGNAALAQAIDEPGPDGRQLLTPKQVASADPRLNELTLSLRDVYGLLDGGDLPWPKWPLCSGGNVGYSRTLFTEIGGFDEGFRQYGLEDGECAYRARTAGASFTYRQSAHATHQYHARHRGEQLADTLLSWRYFVAKHDAPDIWLWLAYRVLEQMTFAQYTELLIRYEAGDADAQHTVARYVRELRAVTPESILALRTRRVQPEA